MPARIKNVELKHLHMLWKFDRQQWVAYSRLLLQNHHCDPMRHYINEQGWIMELSMQ